MPGKTNTNNNTKKKSSANTRIQKKPIFAAIRSVFQQMCKKDAVGVATTKDLQQVMKWGKISREEALVFCFFATQGVNDSMSWWQFEDIQNYIDVEVCDYAEYLPALDNLITKGFFVLRYDMKHVPGTTDILTFFRLPDELIKAICYNQKFTPYKRRDSEADNNCLAYLYRAAKEGFTDRPNYYWDLIKAVYKEDEILKEFLDPATTWGGDLSRTEALMLFTRIGMTLVSQQEPVTVKECLEDIREGDPAFVIRILKAFKSETTPFQQKGYFIVDKSNFGDDIKLTWGDVAKDKIFQGDAQLLIESTKVKELGVIKSDKIKEKHLYYNDDNQADIDRLKGLLENKNYIEMRKRLEEKNMPKGLIILMYGPPGTGKTETAMQLARETGRDLFHVNIQEIRSCWVGETEKNTKKLFETYKKNKNEIKPILLFNEADGIVSKRSNLDDSGNSAVNKMENSMQNIILEEMENFDGIMILTTNLETNLDTAFDRRILFKIKLDNPSKVTKEKIWKDKLDFLKEEKDLGQLTDFNFSGGQIENIRRKVTLDELLYGKLPNIDTIVDFCKKEKLSETSNEHRIGFTS